MGNYQSTQVQPPPPQGRIIAPAPSDDLAIGFSGDMNRAYGTPAPATAPPGISIGGFHGIFSLREVPAAELQDARYGWRRMSNAIPVYVEVPEMGVSVAPYYRYVGGMLTYMVYKLHPLNPELDINVTKRYEVPFMAGQRQLVLPMEVAISGLWPSKDAVFLINNKGQSFRMDFHELMQIKDQPIRIAVGALMKDYPDQLSSALAFRPVATPHYMTYGQSEAPRPQNFTTLQGTPQADALYAALNQQYKCALPPRMPPPAPQTQQVIVPNCGFDNGIPSVFEPPLDNPNAGVGGGFGIPEYAAESKEKSAQAEKVGAEFGSESKFFSAYAHNILSKFQTNISDEFQVDSQKNGYVNSNETIASFQDQMKNQIDGTAMLYNSLSHCNAFDSELLKAGNSYLSQAKQVLEQNPNVIFSY